ncbi:MAG: hypothetical protein WA705_04905 [Candidatus Ozemobacteraceae bacterium]
MTFCIISIPAVHVDGGATHIGDGSAKIGILGERGDLGKNRLGWSRSYAAPLVQRQGAEGA